MFKEVIKNVGGSKFFDVIENPKNKWEEKANQWKKKVKRGPRKYQDFLDVTNVDFTL